MNQNCINLLVNEPVSLGPSESSTMDTYGSYYPGQDFNVYKQYPEPNCYYSNDASSLRMDQQPELQYWHQTPVNSINTPEPSPIGYNDPSTYALAYTGPQNQIWNGCYAPNDEVFPSHALDGSVGPKRRPRTAFTAFQLMQLENEFLNNRYSSRAVRRQLAGALDLTEKQVKVWFQNRRMKEKKQAKAVEDPSAAARSVPKKRSKSRKRDSQDYPQSGHFVDPNAATYNINYSAMNFPDQSYQIQHNDYPRTDMYYDNNHFTNTLSPPESVSSI